MDEPRPLPDVLGYTALHVITAIYSAYWDLHAADVYVHATELASQISPELTLKTDEGWYLTTAGSITLTLRLETLRTERRLARLIPPGEG